MLSPRGFWTRHFSSHHSTMLDSIQPAARCLVILALAGLVLKLRGARIPMVPLADFPGKRVPDVKGSVVGVNM